MRSRSIVAVGLVAMLTLFHPVDAAAQTPPTSGGLPHDDVSTRVKPGSRIWVLTSDGAERPGKLESLSITDVVMVGDDGQRVALPWSRVRRIERPDPLMNGISIGAVAGLGGGLFLATFAGYFGGESGGYQPRAGLALIGMSAGVGALVGFAVDRAKNPRQIVYRSGQTTMALSPVITGRGVGMGIKVRW